MHLILIAPFLEYLLQLLEFDKINVGVWCTQLFSFKPFFARLFGVHPVRLMGDPNDKSSMCQELFADTLLSIIPFQRVTIGKAFISALYIEKFKIVPLFRPVTHY